MSSDNDFDRDLRDKLRREQSRKGFKLSDLRAKKKIYPDQPGAKRHYDIYGDKLYCVRYRYDKKRRLRYTTVEIIVSKSPRNQQDNLDEPFPIKLKSWEDDLRSKLLQGGAYWDAKKHCYFASLWLIRKLAIVDRIVDLDS